MSTTELNPARPLPCGCVPHTTRMRDNSLGQPLWCDTEQQAYCNFECPHQDDSPPAKEAKPANDLTSDQRTIEARGGHLQ
jgi:hypothetical protein